ncbi:hypothetical protein HYU22_05145 [Candidatus Woesearchaeota archaeon]|nr:hypothetical protein [Candidatus Woesearchaeota archaeon]
MKKVIIDTNALMAMVEFKIDLFAEVEKACDFKYEIMVLEGTIKELQQIQAEQRSKFKRAATLMLAVLKAKKVLVITAAKNVVVDDELVQQSRQGALVLTQDRELKKRLSRPYLTIRQKRIVVLVE